MRKITAAIKNLSIIFFALLNIKIFKKIKILINTFFFEDYKALFFGIFIFASLFYKYFVMLNVKDYYLNAKISKITSNGEIIIQRNYYEDKIKIHGIVLPKFFDKCSGDFKNYFFIKMNEYLKENKYLIDIKILKKNPFFKEGVFFIKNENIQEYINKKIFLMQEISNENRYNWCYILEKAQFKPQGFIQTIKNTLDQISRSFKRIFSFKVSNYI